MFEENEDGDDDSFGTTSMDLGELEEMEDALEEEELEEEKVFYFFTFPFFYINFVFQASDVF